MAEARTLSELLRIRHENRRELALAKPYGTALGRKNLDQEPAILVFVERKIDRKWLCEKEYIKPVLKGPDGLECPTDVIEVGADLQEPYPPTRLERGQLALRQRLRGGQDRLSPGSQIGFQRIDGLTGVGTLAAFARCRRGRLGLLTNAHVGTFVGNVVTHPEPKSRIIAHVVRRLESLTVGRRLAGLLEEPNGHFVMDCAFAELASDLAPADDLEFRVPWVDNDQNIQWSDIGRPYSLDLNDPQLAPVGEPVFAVGRTRSEQKGVIRGFAYEHAAGFHVSGYTDYLIGSEEGSYFSQPGDSGKLVLTDPGARPIALLWGGQLLRTHPDYELADHSFAVDIGIILSQLEIDIVTVPTPV